MIKLFWPGIILLLTLTACGSNATTRQNDFTPLTSMVIVATPSTVAANTSIKLTVIGNFSGYFTRDITDQVAFTSNTPSIADFIPTVPARVKGLVPGVTTLTATKGTVTASINLTVSNATVTSPLTVTPANPSVPLGKTAQFTVIGNFSDGTTQDLTFDSFWESSDPSKATITTFSNSVTSQGFVQTVAAGTTVITATFGSTPGSTLLTVTVPALQTIAVTPANPSILSLSSVNFKAIGTYSDGTTPDITSLVTWTSNQPAVATIAANGTATTLTQGPASIVASLGSVSGATNLKVTGGNLTGFALSPASITLAKGTIGRITATGTFSNGTTRDITGILMPNLTSANPDIASVISLGGTQAFVNAIATTTASTTITATYPTFTPFTLTVAVINAQLSNMIISPPSRVLSVGTSGRFTVSGNFSGSIQDLTFSTGAGTGTGADWTSSNTSIASVGNSGLAGGRVSGVATSGGAAVTISAAFGGLTITAPVTVSTRTLQSLTISTPSANPVAGTLVNFSATATFTDRTIQDVTEDATWTTDNTNVAILADSQNQPGAIMVIDSGQANITATFGGITQTLILRVP